MAENKKKVVVYTDWLKHFEELTDDELGKLMRHFFEYINDINPVLEDRLLKVAWKPIETTLKRDLKKWEAYVNKQKENGQKGGRPKKTQKTQAFKNKPKKADNDNDNVNDINKSLLSEVKTSDIPEELKEYYKIALEFQKLFIKNQSERSVKPTHQLRATFKNYVDPIRLILQQDEATADDLRDVYKYLDSNSGQFWQSNILSTSTLREKLPKLLMEARKPKPIKENLKINDRL